MLQNATVRLLAGNLAIVAATLGGAAIGPVVSERFGIPTGVASAAIAVIFGVTAAAFLARNWGRSFGRAMSAPLHIIRSHLRISALQPLIAGSDMRVGVAWRDLDLDLERLADALEADRERYRSAIVELEKAHRSEALQNRAKSQFLATMSHELRTPLNAVQGYAMLLQEDAAASGNSAAVMDLDRIQNASLQLLSLINDILEVSRIEAGTPVATRHVIEIPALVEKTLRKFQSGENCERQPISVSLDPSAEVLFGDAARTEQCLLKLLESARRLSPEEKVELRIRLRRQAGTTRGVNFQLTFRTALMTSDYEKMFEPLAQVNEEKSLAPSSAAFSLSMARRLARFLGGDLITEEAADGRTALSLFLPLVAGSADEKPSTAVGKPGERAKQDGSCGLALIIDDNGSAIDLMRRWLAKLNYDVIAATNGEEGLQIAREQQPDLIFLDVYMPDRSGYEVLAELRRDETIASTPVILVTVDGDRARALESGATDYIRKPAAEEQIRSVLEVYRSPASGVILVIEDNDDAAALVARCAEQVGFSVKHARDGTEGIRMAKDELPDAIVLDIALPCEDGFQVMEQLRSDTRLSAIPVIVMSAGEISAENYRLITKSGYRYFPKSSLSPRELAAQLREVAA